MPRERQHEFELDTEPLISPFSWKNPKARFTYVVLLAALLLCLVAIVVLASTRQRHPEIPIESVSHDPTTTEAMTTLSTTQEPETKRPTVPPTDPPPTTTTEAATTVPQVDPLHEHVVQFSCFPNSGQERECRDMGCQWQDHQVPQFYQNKTYSRYFVVKRDEDSLILRTVSSKFVDQVQELHVTVSLTAGRTIQLKVEDLELRRWRVPIPTLNLFGDETGEQMIEYEIRDDTMVSVRRTSTGAVLFQTDLSKVVMTQSMISMENTVRRDALIGLGPGNPLAGQNHDDEGEETVPREQRSYRVFSQSSSGIETTDRPFHMTFDSHSSAEASGTLLFNSDPMEILLKANESVTYQASGGGVFNLHIFPGPDPIDVVRQYTRAIGRPFLPPYWSLGFQVGLGSGSPQDFETRIDAFDANVPHDAFWMSVTAESAESFEPPSNLNHRRFGLTLRPTVSTSSSYYEQSPLVKHRNLTKVWETDPITGTQRAFVDFTHADVTTIWSKMLTSPHFPAAGGFSLTGSQPVSAPMRCPSVRDPSDMHEIIRKNLEAGTICMESRHAIGSHEDVHNLYSLYASLVTQRALKSFNPQARPLVIADSSAVGQGAHSALLLQSAFSRHQLRSSVRKAVDSSINGQPLFGTVMPLASSDIDDISEARLRQRWSDVSSFFPFARSLSEWTSNEYFIAPNRDLLLIRYKLLPYLYTLFYLASDRGNPVLCSLAMNFPDDANLRSQQAGDQFMWGASVLFSPMLHDGEDGERIIFLPGDSWYDYRTSRLIPQSTADPKELLIKSTQLHIGIRGGSVIPTFGHALSTSHQRRLPFILIAALDSRNQAQGQLYWDDGESAEVDGVGGHHILINFTVKDSLFQSLPPRIPFKDRFKQPMLVSELQVWGVHKSVQQVTLSRGHESSPLEFGLEKETLTIQLRNLDLKDPFTIRWQ